MTNRFHVALLVLTLALLPALAGADAGWMMLTADFKSRPVSLDGIEKDGVLVTPAGGAGRQTIPFDEFLQLDRSTPPSVPAEGMVLFLLGGDRIAGTPAGYVDEEIIFTSTVAGEVKVPLKNARALARAGKVIDNLENAPRSDMIYLANGDKVAGVVTDMSAEQIKISSGGASLDVPLRAIEYVHFAQAIKPTLDNQRGFRLRLADGSTISVRTLAMEGDKIVFTLDGKTPREAPLSSIAGIEQLNGPVSWLSSRPADAIVQTPFFGAQAWPTRMDLTTTGKPIQFAGRTYARGIGVHAYSRLEYSLNGSFEAFRTQYAIATDERARFADVTIRIKVDGEVLHEQKNVRSNVISPVVMVDLPKTAKTLTLEVDYGDANDTHDRLNWIEPALLRQKPIAPPATGPASADQ